MKVPTQPDRVNVSFRRDRFAVFLPNMTAEKLHNGISRRGFVAGSLAMPFLSNGVNAQDAFGEILSKAESYDQLHSISLSVAGNTVFEQAIRGAALSRAVNVKSVSKTLLATLTLIALDKGVLSSVDQPILPILGSMAPTGLDQRTQKITIDHLLTMRSGLERTSGGNYGAWVSSNNWVRYALTRPMQATPGARMIYSTGDYHLLSAVLTQASGRSTLALANEWLARPMGFEFAAWTRDPQGIYMGGNNMNLSPRNMVRIGEMVLQGGKVDGVQVVSNSRLKDAWTPRTRSPFSGHQYGYGWFLTEMAGMRVGFARGYGGQMIYVIPKARAVLAITSDPTRPARSAGYAGILNRLLENDILPKLA